MKANGVFGCVEAAIFSAFVFVPCVALPAKNSERSADLSVGCAFAITRALEDLKLWHETRSSKLFQRYMNESYSKVSCNPLSNGYQVLFLPHAGVRGGSINYKLSDEFAITERVFER